MNDRDELQPPELLTLRKLIEENRGGLSAAQRRLILDMLMLGDHHGEHRYPPSFGPDSSPTAKQVWAILDQLPPKALTVRYRFMLGGMFAGAIEATRAAATAAARANAPVVEPDHDDPPEMP